MRTPPTARSLAAPAFAALLLVAAGCAATPTAPPEKTAPRLVALLDAGQVAEADELFADAGEGAAREPLYPLLFEAARSRYEKGEATHASGVLRFMQRHYASSAAVQEALVYALFLERAESERPPPELVRELGETLDRIARRDAPWIELARAQNAIDRGDLGAAREAYARYRARPQDTSVELCVYVEDVDRYLKSHP